MAPASRKTSKSRARSAACHPQHAAQGPAGLDELQFPAAGSAAGHFVQGFAQVKAHGNFHHSGVVQGAAETENRRAGAALVADAGKPFAAFGDDFRHIGQGFDIVDIGGFAENAYLGGKGRPVAGHRPAALDGFHQSRFLAGNIGISGQGHFQVKTETGGENVGPQQSQIIGLGYGGAGALNRPVVAVTDKDVAVVGSGSVAGQQDALYDRMGVAFQDALVVKSPRIALLAVAEDIFVRGVGTGQESPLGRGGKGGPAAAAQAGNIDLFQNLAAESIVR